MAEPVTVYKKRGIFEVFRFASHLYRNPVGLIFDYKKGKWAFEGRDFPIL